MSANSFCILFALVVNALFATVILRLDLLLLALADDDEALLTPTAVDEPPPLAPRPALSTDSDDGDDPLVTALLTVVCPAADDDLFDCCDATADDVGDATATDGPAGGSEAVACC